MRHCQHCAHRFLMEEISSAFFVSTSIAVLYITLSFHTFLNGGFRLRPRWRLTFSVRRCCGVVFFRNIGALRHIMPHSASSPTTDHLIVASPFLQEIYHQLGRVLTLGGEITVPFLGVFYLNGADRDITLPS